MNAVIYARYSSHSQTEQSIEGQLRDCTDFAQNNGYTIVGTYIDRAMTGRNDQRADFRRMLKDAERGHWSAVIVWKLDRFGRNREEIAMNKVKLRKCGVKLVYAKENVPDTPEGIILESVLEGLAEYYSANLSQNIRRGMRESALKCQCTGAGLSLGYDVAADKKYVINEAEASIVREIFALYDGGMTSSDIIRRLNERGCRTKTGRPYDHNAVARILRNERYIGVYRWHEILVPDGMPRIIDNELWESVQQKVNNNKKAARPRVDVDFLLTGKIYCGSCGGNMIGDSGTSKTGAKHYYYSCSARKNKKNDCRKKSVKKEYIERCVVKYTVDCVLTDGFIKRISERLEDMQKKECADDSMITYYKSQLATVQTSLSNILKAIEAGIFNDTTQARIIELEAARDEAIENIAREEHARPVIPKEVIAYSLSKYRNGDIADEGYCHWIIDTLISRVVVYDDRVIITFNFTGDGSEATIEAIEEAAESAESYADFMDGASSDKLPNTPPYKRCNFDTKLRRLFYKQQKYKPEDENAEGIFMRIFALQLDNNVKGISSRKKYIESLIASLPNPDLVVLPELAVCSYMASQKMWEYADNCGQDTAEWTISMAQKYNTFIGAGYLDKENGDYYNRYLIAGENGVCGVVTKSEGESAVFKRGDFDSIIKTPFGNVAVAICYDAKRKHFYNKVKDESICLILFPHGCPAAPQKPDEEIKTNDYFCGCYEAAFDVPVVYVNSIGELEYMPGKMGELMKKNGFLMNGRTKIYGKDCIPTDGNLPEAFGVCAEIQEKKRKGDVHFHSNDIIKGNWIFRKFILEPDTKRGIEQYEASK